MKLRLRILILLSAIYITGVFGQTSTVTLYPSKDATISSLTPYMNYGESNKLGVLAWESEDGASNIERFLLHFDIENAGIPSNAYILSANLTLKGMLHMSGGHGNDCILNYISESWNENEVSWAYQPFITQNNEIYLHGTEYSEEDLTINVVEWIRSIHAGETEYPNYGFLIRLLSEIPNTKRTYYSKEAEQPEFRPTLQISYSVPTEMVVDVNPSITNPHLPNSSSVSVNMLQGDAPFQYQWSANASENSSVPQVNGLGPGTYSVTITDANQISITRSVGIGYDPDWKIKESSRFTYTGGVLKKIGGSINWHEIMESSQVLPASTDGWIEYTVKGFSGRKMYGFGQVNLNPNNNWLDIEYGVYLKADNTMNLVTSGSQVALGGYYKGDVIRIGRVGTTFSIYKNGQIVTGSTRNFANGLSQAITAKVVCYDISTQIEMLRTSFGSSMQVRLNPTNVLSGNDGEIELTVSGGVASYTYSWSNGQTTRNISGLSAGEYILTITDAMGMYKLEEVQLVSGNDDQWNWTEDKYYDFNGNLISANKVYYDGLENEIQRQNKSIELNNVLINQTIYDKIGVAVSQTLSAPRFQQDFDFYDNFIQANDGALYDHTKFDVENYSTSSNALTKGEVDYPYPVKNTIRGTLGWYYSNNNLDEPYVATVATPYSRIEYSQLNPGDVRRSSLPHNKMKMGSGNESKSFEMPVAGELAYFFGYATGWQINKGFGYGFFLNEGENTMIRVFGIPERPFIKKAFKTVNVDGNGLETVIFKDIDGKVIASCISGPNESGVNVNEFNTSSQIEELSPGSFVDIHIPKGCESSLLPFEKFSGAKNYKIYDLKTDEEIYSGDGQSIALNAGYYRIVDLAGGDITTIRYKLNYYNINLNYYDHVGRLAYTVSPKGFDQNYNFSGLTTSTTYGESGFDYDQTYTPQKWKFTNSLSSSEPFQFEHAMTSNPEPDKDLQYSNILLYLAEINDPVAIVTQDVNAGMVSTAESQLEDDGSGMMMSMSGPATEQMYVSSSSTGLLSVGEIASGEMVVGGGTTWTFGDDPYSPCSYTPPGKMKYSYKLSVELYAEYLDENSIMVQELIGKPKEIYAYQYYTGIWQNSPLEWAFYSSTDDGDLAYENGLSNRSLNGALVYSIGQKISNTITKLIVKVDNITGGEYYPVIGYNCPYGGYLWDYRTIDLQRLEDDLEMRVKEITFNLDSVDFAPEHEIAEIFKYNALDQVISRWTENEGTTDYLYNIGGRLRFSQNEEQRTSNPKRFSYSNYDSQGRVVETGEAVEDNVAGLRFQNYKGEISMNPGDQEISSPTILNSIGSLQLTDSEKNDPSYFVYDQADPNFGSTYSSLPNIGSNYQQRFVWGKLSYSYVKNGAVIQNKTYYSYDPLGRVEWTVQDVNGLGVKTKNIEYTDRGEIQKVIYQKHSPSEYFEHFYTYDLDGRLKQAYTREANNQNYQKEAEYFYYIHGPLKRVELADNLQGIDYIYNSLGYLKAINSPELGNTGSKVFSDPGNDGRNGFNADVFGMALDYFNGDYTRSGTYVNSGNNYRDQFDGKIKAMRWNTMNQTAGSISGRTAHWTYSYAYNNKGWLTEAQFGRYKPDCQNFASGEQPCVAMGGPSLIFDANDAYRVDNLSYDILGNIQGLRRRAVNGVVMDNFIYNYDATYTNRLSHLDDAAASNSYNDLEDQAALNYEYDALGRMTRDVAANHKLIYNSYGLVKEVQKSNGGTFIPVVKYFYDENGQRLSKITYNNNGNAIAKQWYLGGVKYKQDLLASTTTKLYEIIGASRLGVYERTGGVRTYELSDHLGNVRATVSKNSSGNLNLLSYADYYPFGMEMPGRRFVSGDEYDHKYQGQYSEHDDEVEWEAFELRNWDGRLARWTSIDPANQYWSPYLGMGNSPTNMVDPDGAYSKFGAWWRNGFSMDGVENVNGDWGIKTSTMGPSSVGADGTMNLGELDIQWEFGDKSSQGLFIGLSDRIQSSLISTSIALNSQAHSLEISGTLAAGGGASFKLGIGRDGHGNWFNYSSIGLAAGYDATIGGSYTNYSSNQAVKYKDLGGGSIEVAGGGLFGDISTGKGYSVIGGFNNINSYSIGASFGLPVGGSIRFYNTNVNVW